MSSQVTVQPAGLDLPERPRSPPNDQQLADRTATTQSVPSTKKKSARWKRLLSRDLLKNATILALVLTIVFGAGTWAGQNYANQLAITGNNIAKYSLCSESEELRSTTRCKEIMAQVPHDLGIEKRNARYQPGPDVTRVQHWKAYLDVTQTHFDVWRARIKEAPNVDDWFRVSGPLFRRPREWWQWAFTLFGLFACCDMTRLFYTSVRKIYRGSARGLECLEPLGIVAAVLFPYIVLYQW